MGVFILAALFSCSTPPQEAATPLKVVGRKMLDGRFEFTTGVVLGDDRWLRGEMTKGEAGVLPKKERWPDVWRFKKESVEIIDDKGRRYDPKNSWDFGKMKPSGVFLGFGVPLEPDAQELYVKLNLVINDRRFVVDEKFVKHPKGRWYNSRYPCPYDSQGNIPEPHRRRLIKRDGRWFWE